MVDFRKKLLGLAGMAVAFAGMANAQVACTTIGAVPGANFIRAEGQTELVPQLQISGCAGTLPNTGTGSVNVTVYFSPAVTITSPASGLAVSATAPNGSTEAQLVSAGGTYYGTVVGSSVTFTGVAIATTTPTFTISNIRVNATGIPSAQGQAPTAITAQAFISGTNVTPGPTNSTPVAYTINGLQQSKIYQDALQQTAGNKVGSPFGVCGSLNNSSNNGNNAVSFYVSVNENFSTAFKSKLGTALGGSNVPYNTSGAGGSESSNVGLDPTIVNSGTRIKVTFSNVPTGLNLYAATSVTAGDGAILTAQVTEAGATGASNNATAITSPTGLVGGGLPAFFQVPVSNNTATAIYEVTTDNPGTDVFSIPVLLQAGTNAVAIQSTSLSVQTSFAPVVAATTVPSFVVGSSTASTTVLSFTTCTTTLLFPFVTNQAGFETGIAIANTSKDPFGSAKPQSGTCTLNYYGTSATNPSSTLAPNTNETTGAPYLPGEAYAFTLTNALAATAGNPATFQGYVVAACNFQFAHGFAYIVYNFPGTSSDTMGYLALSIGRGATNPESSGH